MHERERRSVWNMTPKITSKQEHELVSEETRGEGREVLERLQSQRVELVSLGSEFLEALLANDASQAAHIGGFHIPDSRMFSPSLLRRRLHQMQINPDIQPWLLRAIVIRASRILCGRIGFHSAPALMTCGMWLPMA